MNAWPTAPIGTLCRLVNGRAFKPTDWTDEGVPIVRIQNLNDEDKPFNRFAGEVKERFLVDSGDILLSWSGTPGTSFGCFVWSRGRAILNQHIFRVEVDEDCIDRDYFVHAVNSRLDEMIALAHGGVGLRHITKGKLEGIKLPLPPLGEQRRIVSRIAACLERVDEIRVLRMETRRDSRAVFRSVVSETYSSLVKTEQTCPLGELAVPMGGGTPDRRHPEYWTGTIPWVSPKDMKVFEIADSEEHISLEGLAASAAKLIQPPAVLFVVRGMILTHTLPVAVTRVPVAINQDMKALQVLPKCRAEFLAYMIRGTESDLLGKVEIAGHGTRRLQSRHWMGTLIPMPSIKTQDHIVERLRRAEASSAEVASIVDGTDVNALSAAVLRRAFSGEL